MARFLVGGGCFVTLAAWALLVSQAPAADPPAHGSEGGTVVFLGTVHTPEGEEERKFNLNNEADAEALSALLRKGEVNHLHREEPVNILALRWDLGLWTLVVFFLLVLVLRKVAWGPMLEGLRKREENIKSALEESRKAREEAEELRRKLQHEMDTAQEKVRDLMDEARRDAQQNTEAMLAKARAEIQTERDRLRREIDTARDQAIQELWNQTAILATQISSKAIRRQLSEDDHRRLVEEALVELRQANLDKQHESGVGT